MNTKEVQDKISGLRTADIAAYKAGEKSNYVTNYIRNELIKHAYKVSNNLDKETSVKFSMAVASNAIASISLLTRTGLYPSLFDKAELILDNGDITFNYIINVKGLSDEYKNKLNESLDINIPMEV